MQVLDRAGIPYSVREFQEEKLGAEEAAEKLGLPLATVEAEFDAGTTLYQIAQGYGIAQEDIRAFMLEVRTTRSMLLWPMA